ncbi:MAG: hypothetical protein P4L50_10240, partial [Anaerolineaceae bacterium]|nr:hypothetical protein [Anaerolineaceae bacterium]
PKPQNPKTPKPLGAQIASRMNLDKPNPRFLHENARILQYRIRSNDPWSKAYNHVTQAHLY